MANDDGMLVSAPFMRDMAAMKTLVLGSSRTKSRRFRRRRGGAGGGSVDIDVVLITDDIDAVEEDEDAELADEAVAYQNPEGTDVDSLSLCAFEPRTVSLKVYRLAGVDDPGYEDGKNKMILDTEEVPDDPDEPDGPKHTQYVTQEYLVHDSDELEVGEYDQGDYPDFEGDDWPPPDLPDGFLKRRIRGVAIGGVLILEFCTVLPPPALPSGGE